MRVFLLISKRAAALVKTEAIVGGETTPSSPVASSLSVSSRSFALADSTSSPYSGGERGGAAAADTTATKNAAQESAAVRLSQRHDHHRRLHHSQRDRRSGVGGIVPSSASASSYSASSSANYYQTLTALRQRHYDEILVASSRGLVGVPRVGAPLYLLKNDYGT